MHEESEIKSEVKPYLKRLITFIIVGILLMTGTAIWAWKQFGGKLEQAPPLPSGSPPFTQPSPPPSP